MKGLLELEIVEVEIEYLGRKDKFFFIGDGENFKLDGFLIVLKFWSDGVFLEVVGSELYLRCLFKCLNENFLFFFNGVF